VDLSLFYKKNGGKQPKCTAWKASALPLSYTRSFKRLWALAYIVSHVACDARADCHDDDRFVNVSFAECPQLGLGCRAKAWF